MMNGIESLNFDGKKKYVEEYQCHGFVVVILVVPEVGSLIIEFAPQ